MSCCPFAFNPHGVVRIVLVVLFVLALILAPASGFAALLGWWHDTPWLEVENLLAGLTCSLIVWLFVTVFHLRAETHYLSVHERGQFLRRARNLLIELGYEISVETDQEIAARPGFQALLLGGGIQFVVRGHLARVHGPKYTLELLRKRLRVAEHLDKLQTVLQEPKHFSELFIKRVELSLGLRPDQLSAVQINVLEPLAEQGKLRCQLTIQASYVDGIRDHTIEQVRGWLDQQGIAADLHKDHVQFKERFTLRQVAPQELSV